MRRTDCTEILKALADRNRIRLVSALVARELSVNDLAAALALSQYNVSKHLRVLRHAGIVSVRAAGTSRKYAIAPKFNQRIDPKSKTLDFGCCSFDFDRLAH
ncbi:MAG: metalloregulator ArsR/SmtB family transcription factor [Verrucomicrobiota bacterium]|nr:metalloregulator ArsR/SmtB family transcription factor [Verrucomicrobiota bacterium]